MMYYTPEVLMREMFLYFYLLGHSRAFSRKEPETDTEIIDTFDELYEVFKEKSVLSWRIERDK